MDRTGLVRKLNPDGTENPTYVDLLDEDKPISGQKFVCVSFVSPENILKQKNNFLFEQFLKHFDFSKSVEKFRQFLSFVSGLCPPGLVRCAAPEQNTKNWSRINLQAPRLFFILNLSLALFMYSFWLHVTRMYTFTLRMHTNVGALESY